MNSAKRWPIIRHVRWLALSWRFWNWWGSVGYLLGAVPNPSDIEYLNAVRKGKA